MPEHLLNLIASDGTTFTLSAAGFAALEGAADDIAYAARPFFAECPATAAEADALADFIMAGSATAWRDDGSLDVSAPYAACVRADPALFLGPAAAALVWFLCTSGGFAVEDVQTWQLPRPSVN